MVSEGSMPSMCPSGPPHSNRHKMVGGGMGGGGGGREHQEEVREYVTVV